MKPFSITFSMDVSPRGITMQPGALGSCNALGTAEMSSYLRAAHRIVQLWWQQFYSTSPFLSQSVKQLPWLHHPSNATGVTSTVSRDPTDPNLRINFDSYSYKIWA